MTAVLLIDPKYPHNVGGALRACACWGIDELAWTGERVPSPEQWPAGARLPREERLRIYRAVSLRVFGPEDGGVPKGVRHWCHRFVTIPTANDGPLNLAAAVNVVLYDRLAKFGA